MLQRTGQPPVQSSCRSIAPPTVVCPATTQSQRPPPPRLQHRAAGTTAVAAFTPAAHCVDIITGSATSTADSQQATTTAELSSSSREAGMRSQLGGQLSLMTAQLPAEQQPFQLAAKRQAVRTPTPGPLVNLPARAGNAAFLGRPFVNLPLEALLQVVRHLSWQETVQLSNVGTYLRSVLGPEPSAHDALGPAALVWARFCMLDHSGQFRSCMADLKFTNITWMKSYLEDAFASVGNVTAAGALDPPAGGDAPLPNQGGGGVAGDGAAGGAGLRTGRLQLPFMGWGAKLHRHNWYAAFAVLSRPDREELNTRVTGHGAAKIPGNLGQLSLQQPSGGDGGGDGESGSGCESASGLGLALTQCHPAGVSVRLGVGIPCDKLADSRCPCKRVFPNMWRLHDHCRDHITGPRKCPHCEHTLQNVSSLNKHVREVHTTASSAFRCCYCSKEFKAKSALTKHEKIHTGSSRVSCVVAGCSKTFCSFSSRRDHVNRVHKKLRPFQCPECNRSFAVQSALTGPMPHRTPPQDTPTGLCTTQSCALHHTVFPDTSPTSLPTSSSSILICGRTCCRPHRFTSLHLLHLPRSRGFQR